MTKENLDEVMKKYETPKGFILKEKRKELKDKLIGAGFYLGDIENILKIVDEQDKEFIRLLEENGK